MGYIRQYFNEYLFQQTVEQVNKVREDQGMALMTTREAKRLRDEFTSQLASQNTDIGRANRTITSSVLSDMFQPYVGDASLFDVDDKVKTASEFTYRKFQEFQEYIGWNNIRTHFDKKMLPISPYDPRYANRSTFLQNGGGLLFVDYSDMFNVDNTPTNESQFTIVCQTVNARGELVDLRNRNGDSMALQTMDDLSGLSALMPMMSKKEYDDVHDWVTQIGEDKYMSDAAISRAATVLRMMNEEGIPYTVERDENPGQIKARITGTKTHIRLMDTRDHEYFAGGHVYDNGRVYYYSTNRVIMENGKSKTASFVPSAVQSLRLLHYAMGQPVRRWNYTNTKQEHLIPSGNVGQPSVYTRPRLRKLDKPIGNRKYEAIQQQANAAYMQTSSFSAVVSPDPQDSRYQVMIRSQNYRSTAYTPMNSKAESDEYLKNAIDSARMNFADAIAIDRLIEDAHAHGRDEGYQPEFSSEQNIAAIQQKYWEILTSTDELIVQKPGIALDAYEDAVGTDDITQDEQAAIQAVYIGTPEEKVRQHFADNVDYLIGQFEPDMDGKRFDPINVTAYMTSAYGNGRNRDDIVSALRVSGISADELKGNDFYTRVLKDKLIEFNPDTAVPMKNTANPFMKTMYNTIYNTLNTTGCIVDAKDILIDDNGIVHYSGMRITGENIAGVNGKMEQAFEGQIGQIFVPDGLGMVETKFAGSENYLFVPGYEATVVSGPGTDGQSLEERTRLRGYEQIMKDQLAHTIRNDLMSMNPIVGETTGVNQVYRSLYEERHPLNWLEETREDGMSDSLREAIIATEARRVRYENAFKEGSTVNAQYRAENGLDDDIDSSNDNFQDAYRLTGHRNLAVMDEHGDGYFDPIATSSGTNQGVVRYLTEDAVVDSDGKIQPGDPNGRTPLMNHEICQFMHNTPFDRQQMTFSNIMKGQFVASGVKVAQMNIGLWTFDDGYVVSKDFAERCCVRGGDGQLRPMVIGDKISDMSGNKGVVSFVVDPDMPPEEAEKQGIGDLVKLFHDNKGNLDVVGAPYAPVSRFNGGSARELMQHPHDLVLDGDVHEGCIGETNIIVTHMAVDKKTHAYDEDDVAQGKGRKASAQLAWAMASQDCPNVLREFYGSNNAGFSNFRECMISLGMDVGPTGEMRIGYEPHPGEKRRVFPMTELKYKDMKDGKKRLAVADMKAEFGDLVSRTGGFLELPFPLTFRTGDKTDVLTVNSKVNVNYQKLEWERKGYIRKDGVEVKPTIVHRNPDANTVRGHDETYALPIISSHLRSEQKFEDGTSHVHDITNQYLRVYEQSLKYRDAEKRGDTKAMADCQKKAQQEFDKITTDLEHRMVMSKRNMFREGMMSNRMPHSATAVWTADPRRAIDEIAVGPDIAKSMEIKDSDYVLVLRDPVLRDGGVKYMKVVVDEKLHGAAINPVMDKGFDGDFDGDTVGLIKLQSKAAQDEAMRKLSVQANLLDKGSMDENGNYGLMIQDGLDLKAVLHDYPELATRREELTQQINDADKSPRTPDMKLKLQTAYMHQLNEYVHDVTTLSKGQDILCFKDTESHMRSVGHMVEDGAKGNYKKMQTYARYYGVDMPLKDNGTPDYENMTEFDHPLTSRKDDKDTMLATAIKAFGTGVAGRYSQRGIEALRNECPKAVLELTYPVTQALLQAKHDPVDAAHKYDMAMSTARKLWQGYKMEPGFREDGSRTWHVAQRDGKPVMATRDEWVRQFKEIYTSPDGLNININPIYVEQVADCLSKRSADGQHMINIEKMDTGKSFMDVMAYDGSTDKLIDGACQHVNIFEGRYNSQFAPVTVRRNMIAAECGEEVVPVGVKTDVKESYQPKVPDAPSVVTRRVTVTADRKPIDTGVVDSVQAKATGLNHPGE